MRTMFISVLENLFKKEKKFPLDLSTLDQDLLQQM